MPGRSNLVSRNLKQTAVYWGGPLNDGWGMRSFDPPIEVPVRWEGRSELFMGDDGRQIVSRAVVYSDQVLDIGGYLYLGLLSSLSSDPEPSNTPTAYIIKQFSSVPNLSAGRFVYKGYL